MTYYVSSGTLNLYTTTTILAGDAFRIIVLEDRIFSVFMVCLTQNSLNRVMHFVFYRVN